ncbi:MAG TPA: PqqD family protein [Acidimicrobiales bacterium]|nr:PqqD family protein [Acidimicrobiales bacterium]
MAVNSGNLAVVKRAGVSWREVEGEVIVLDVAASEYFALNRSASFLWSALGDDGASPKTLADALSNRYGVSAEQAAGDVATFLDHCAASGLVEIDTRS